MPKLKKKKKKMMMMMMMMKKKKKHMDSDTEWVVETQDSIWKWSLLMFEKSPTERTHELLSGSCREWFP